MVETLLLAAARVKSVGASYQEKVLPRLVAHKYFSTSVRMRECTRFYVRSRTSHVHNRVHNFATRIGTHQSKEAISAINNNTHIREIPWTTVM